MGEESQESIEFLDAFGANLKTTKSRKSDALSSGDIVALCCVMNGVTPPLRPRNR